MPQAEKKLLSLRQQTFEVPSTSASTATQAIGKAAAHENALTPAYNNTVRQGSAKAPKAAEVASSSSKVANKNIVIDSAHKANNANAQAAMNKKMGALEAAQKEAVKIQEFPDGRVRYYAAEKLSKVEGVTRGASYVTEFNPKTGQVRSWMECYDHSGNVNRIHPKMIDGQDISGPHYPPTKAELGTLSKKPGVTK